MAKTNAQTQRDFRDSNLKLGRKELRGIYATEPEQDILKKEMRERLKTLRKQSDQSI